MYRLQKHTQAYPKERMNMLDEIHKTHIHTSKIVLSFIIESCLDFPIMRKALKHYRSKEVSGFSEASLFVIDCCHTHRPSLEL